MTDKHTLDLQQWGSQISRKITRISGGGSEMTLRIGEDFYADPVATCARIEEKLEGHRRRYSKAATRITALEAEKAELVERLHWREEALRHAQGRFLNINIALSSGGTKREAIGIADVGEDCCKMALAREELPVRVVRAATLAKARQSEGEGK